MALIYSENTPPFTGRPVPYHDQNAVRYWGTHYENYLYLIFIKQHSTDRAEVRQAESEIRICQTKMNHWVRHMNFTASEAARVRTIADNKWQR